MIWESVLLHGQCLMINIASENNNNLYLLNVNGICKCRRSLENEKLTCTWLEHTFFTRSRGENIPAKLKHFE